MAGNVFNPVFWPVTSWIFMSLIVLQGVPPDNENAPSSPSAMTPWRPRTARALELCSRASSVRWF